MSKVKKCKCLNGSVTVIVPSWCVVSVPVFYALNYYAYACIRVSWCDCIVFGAVGY